MGLIMPSPNNMLKSKPPYYPIIRDAILTEVIKLKRVKGMMGVSMEMQRQDIDAFVQLIQ